jgi:hypothetical protein
LARPRRGTNRFCPARGLGRALVFDKLAQNPGIVQSAKNPIPLPKVSLAEEGPLCSDKRRSEWPSVKNNSSSCRAA